MTQTKPVLPPINEPDCSTCDYVTQDLFDLICTHAGCWGPTYSNEPKCGGFYYLNTGNE